MQRAAVFVDAGYLFAQGSILLAGTRQGREHLALDIPATVEALCGVVERQSGMPLLRIYWYDAIRQGRPSAEHSALADHTNVKLRLGQINSVGEQKGVDALIITDLADLARNQAMADAVLVSGDEDLRVGVMLAQQFGVRVHLVGIKPALSNQSRSLRQEADTTLEWDEAVIRSVLAYRPPVAPAPGAAEPRSLELRIAPLIATLPSGRRAELKERLTIDPKVPPDIDKYLLRLGREHHARDTLTETERSALRSTFSRLIRAD